MDDAQLLRNVRDELAWDPAVDHPSVQTVVQDGVALLSGTVTNYEAKLAAVRAARRTFGIRGVFDGIVVGTDPEATDAAILERVRTMLELDANVPSEALTVSVERGRVTLRGAVEWKCQREAARAAAGRVRGVAGITCSVEVTGIPSLAHLRGLVLSALQKTAEDDAAAVSIAVGEGTVTLSGMLPSEREREIVVAAIRAAPGVIAVDDRTCIDRAGASSAAAI